MGSTTPTPYASPRHTALWSPTPITQPISEPRPSLTPLRNSLHSAKHYATSYLIAEADTLPSGRGIIRPDSELAAGFAMGTITPARNQELAAKVHHLYTILSKNALSCGDTCADTAITNGTTMLTTSPILAEGDSETSRPRGGYGKTKPPEPKTPHLLPYP
jgi:hypothetical protein